MGRTTFNDDVHVNGTLTAARFNPPVNSVGASAIQAAAGIEATKLEHQFPISVELFAEGTNIAALASRVVHVVKGASGEVVAVEGVIFGAATGDRTATVDLQKSTGAGAFASILTTTVDIDATTLVRTSVAGVVASPDLLDGDILRLVVTIGGSTGTQPQGLLLTVTLREDP